MPRIVTALFEDHAAAERALQALIEAGVARDRIALIGESEGRDVSSISGFRELSARDDSLASLHDLPLPDEDLRLFEQGLGRGHALLSARVDAENMEEAVNVIDLFDPLDIDHRSRDWQQAQSGGGGGGGVDVGGPLAAGLTGGNTAGTTNTSALPGTGSLTTGTHDSGAADPRTREASASDMGLSSTAETGGRRAEARAGAPGVLELSQGQTVNASAGQGFLGGGDRYRRETDRTGRVRVFARDD